MQAKPCMNRVYLLCAGVTHLCQAQQHMCPYKQGRLEAFLSGVYCTLLGRIYCSECGVLKAGKDFRHLIFMKCSSDQLRNENVARFNPCISSSEGPIEQPTVIGHNSQFLV